MDTLKIIVAVDGNNKIGMGHVYRSLNLMQIFKKNNEVFFLTKDKISYQIISKHFKCKLVKTLHNKTSRKFLQEFSPDIVIIDKLKETKTFLKIIRTLCPIIAIDYTGKHKELINYGINILYPKTGIRISSYSDTNYAILNDKILKSSKKIITKRVQNILVLQGGADTYCFTPKIVKAINEISHNIKISVVLGPSFKCWSKLNKELKKIQKPIKIYHNVKNMAPIFKKNDVAITAGGNTLLELAYLGIPSIVVCGEQFEIETAKLFQIKGFGINAGFGKGLTQMEIVNHLEKIIGDYKLRQKMNKTGPRLVDGKGNLRIKKIIQEISTQN